MTPATWGPASEQDLDPAVVQSTIAAAQASPRLRAHAALPTTADGWSHTLIALTSESYVPPHFHPSSVDAHNCERLVSVRGRCAALLFDASGKFSVVYLHPDSSEVAVMRQGDTGNGTSLSPTRRVVKGIDIGAGIPHSLIAIDPIAIVSEFKVAAESAHHSKVVLPNFPAEQDSAVPAIMLAWHNAVDY